MDQSEKPDEQYRVPEMKELLNKSKDELDRIKGALEIEYFAETRRLERIKNRRDTWQVYVYPLLFLILTLFSNYFFYQKNRNDTQSDQEGIEVKRLVNKYREGGPTDTLKKYACAIGNYEHLRTSAYITIKQDSFTKKCDSLTGQVSQLARLNSNVRDKTSGLDSTTAPGKQILNVLTKSDDRLNQLENQRLQAKSSSEKQKVSKDIQFVFDSVSHLTDLSPEIKSAVKSMEAISQNVGQPASAPVDNKTDFGVQWVKVGYYLQYDNMRVLLLDLDKSTGAKVRICKTIGSDICDDEHALFNNRWISYNSPLDVNIDGFHYQIVLKEIDHAGNNPFKLAAFLNVNKSKD